MNSEPIEIVVKPRSYRQMGKYIKSLVSELKSTEDRYEKDRVIKKLMFTCDRRIVPTLIDSMYEKGRGFWESEAFVCYLPRDRKIKEHVLHVAEKRGLAAGMQAVLEAFDCSESEFKEIISVSLASDDVDILGWATIAAQEHPDDEHMAKLITIATNATQAEPDEQLHRIDRERAIYAIAHNRTNEGVKALRALLGNPDKEIRRTASHAIRYAYRRHPVYPKHSDDKYTAKLVPIAMDCNDPRQTSMIVEIVRTRTQEGVEAIETLLEDPDSNIPLAEADEGVKAIRDLLRSRNKDVRDMTAAMIRAVYRTYPGRPLRYDDFGDEFRESFEERKRRVLERLRTQPVQ